MKVLLVLPFSNSFLLTPDLGLGYLSASLLKKGIDAHILDCVLHRMNKNSFFEHIKKTNPDIVGFKVFSKDLETTRQAISAVKQVSIDIPVIIGGPHVSGVGKNIFDHFKDFDFAVSGEGEIALPLLIDYYTTRDESFIPKIPGLIWLNRDSKEIISNPPSNEKDLDQFDFPDWKGIAPQNYPPAPHCSFAENFPIAPIITTRGCPCDCTFCSVQNTFGRGLRFRSTDRVLQEISMIYNDLGIREIHFEDDNFTCNKKFAIQLCNKLIDSGLKISWSCPNGVRLDMLDEEILEAMKKSGCYSFAVGIESGSQKILDDMKKKITIETIREKVSLVKKFGIKIHGFFIIGYPTETKKDILQTLKFSRELELDTVYFNIFNPFPGTEVFDKLESEGKLKNFSWDTLFSDRPSIPLQDVSMYELKKLQKMGMILFYLRPRKLLNMLSRFKSFKHILYILRRIWSILSVSEKKFK
jgi:anaerobic magnesium-protoporphyrin IX monomethyl ester cyclase